MSNPPLIESGGSIGRPAGLRPFAAPAHPQWGMPPATARMAAAAPPRPSSFAIEVPGALLARARSGDRAAFEQVYRWFERPVYTLALRICGCRNEADDVLFKIKDDPRVTRLGSFLRKASLDELPQLLNVVRGEMALVGPRPFIPSEVAQMDQDTLRRHAVQPGITGLWQVSGRSDLDWADGIRLDLYYVENWSMTQDLQILWRTARAVVSSSGAY